MNVRADREQTRQEKEEREAFLVDSRYAITGGAIAATIALAGTLSVGRISGGESLLLIEATVPTIRFFSAAVMTASATTLALMLTLLSLSYSTEVTLDRYHYRRVRQIAQMCTVALISATILLLLLSIPLRESEEVGRSWYNVIYYTLIILSSALGGILITIVLMLFNAVKGMIEVVHRLETD